MVDPRVVAVCGSLRDQSYTRVGLQRALDAAGERGASTDLVDLRDLDLPVFDPDADEPPGAAAMCGRLRDGDAILLGTPMYHGSYSSPLKTALDYAGFDEFEDTTVGLFAVSGGAFPVTALDHLRAVCRALKAWVMPHDAVVPRARDHIEDGAFVDDRLAGRVDELGRNAVQYAGIAHDCETFEGDQNVGGDR